jgi:hypothetical protein
MHLFRPLAGSLTEAVGDIEDIVDLKINVIPDNTMRQRRLRSQCDDGRPREDDIVREHFAPRG